MNAADATGSAGAQTTELVSVSASGGGANSDCTYPAISADGSSVAFATPAAIIPPDSNGEMDIFLRALPAGPTTRVNAARADGFSQHTSTSATDGKWDIFVHDRDTGKTTRVSVGTGGVQGERRQRDPIECRQRLGRLLLRSHQSRSRRDRGAGLREGRGNDHLSE